MGVILWTRIPSSSCISLSPEPGSAIRLPLRDLLEAKFAWGPRRHRLVAFRQEPHCRLSELHSHTQRPVCVGRALRPHSSFDLYQLLMTLSEKTRIWSSMSVIDHSPPFGTKVSMNSL